ncbi:unnamed protein product, partial [Chrysoparadoxa australica]
GSKQRANGKKKAEPQQALVPQTACERLASLLVGSDLPANTPELLLRFQRILGTVMSQASAAPFLEPMDPAKYGSYYEMVKRPVCLEDVSNKVLQVAEDLAVQQADLHATLNLLIEDTRSVFANAHCYFPAGSTAH